jgi:hypothetical protein
VLTTRTPSPTGQTSNGHARRTAEGGSFHGSATNLFVIGKGGVSRAELTRRLVAAARAEGLPYGLVIKRFDDAAITGAPEFSRRELVQMLKSGDQALPPPAILAYRVYPNGKQELVRGAQMAEVPIRAWKDILGVSKDVTTYNFLAAGENQILLRVQGGIDDGLVPSGGIESGVITPDLLLKEIDVSASTSERLAPVLAKPGK